MRVARNAAKGPQMRRWRDGDRAYYKGSLSSEPFVWIYLQYTDIAGLGYFVRNSRVDRHGILYTRLCTVLYFNP